MRKTLSAAVLALVFLAGCAGMNRAGPWPSLAPRAAEISPLVPRTPLGACNCGPDTAPIGAVPVAAVPAPVVAPSPADAGARLDAAERVIATVEKSLPAQVRATRTAIAAAHGETDSDAGIAAEVQRSRWEALFLPLADQTRVLDDLETELAGTADAAPLLVRLEAARERIAGLQAQRTAVSGL